MKRFVCALCALLLLAGFAAQAEEGIWEFDYDDYKMKAYHGESGAVVIPDEIEGCTVDILGMDLFSDDDALTSLTLPSTLRQVEDNAVSFCDNLVELLIPEGVQVIGDNCFICNPALTEVTIPASVCYIGAHSFESNDGLEKVTFLGECPVFADDAFTWLADDAEIYVPDDQYDAYAAALYEAECYSAILPSGANAVEVDWATDPELFDFDASTGTITLFNGFGACVEIPDAIGGVPVKAIGEGAFANHRYLCCLALPEGLESIGASAFEWCENLVYIDFPASLKDIGSCAFYAGYKGYDLQLPAVESIGDEAFAQCIRISEPVYLPDGLKRIGNGAFNGCGWLTEVYVPASVESIGEKAFADSAMNYLVFEGVDLPDMAENALENCWYLADIDLHTKASKQEMLDMQAIVDGLGLSCRVWRMQNPDVDYIYDGLDSYENGVMTGYTGEQTHLRPYDEDDGLVVTAIGEGVFKDNQTLEYFAVPYSDGFTTIGAEAFAGSSVRVVDLFDSVTTIEEGAFRNCENLEELVLPESVSSVGAGALSGCTGLKKLMVLCDASVLPDDLLEGCSAELEVYAGENATDEQLKHLSHVAGRAWNNPVTRIGEPLPQVQAMPYAPLPGEDFWYDADFARLDRYNGYERNLILPRDIDGVPLEMLGGDVMGRAAYGDDYEMELPVVSVVIPETYTEIVSYAFANCETLETVVCYAPIELLSDCAFSNCTNLREVIFVNGVHSIGQYVFDNCPKLEKVYIGPYTENIGEYAFSDLNGEAVWSLEQCIADPALMPDIDALLDRVKLEPMPTPEPTPTPEPIVPVGEEGKPFFGKWIGTEMDMGGEIMKFSDWDMEMILILLEDGRMIMSDEEITDLSGLEEYDLPAWRVENGVGISNGVTMTIAEDGRLVLVMEEDGSQMYFVRGEQEISVQPAATIAPEAAAPAADAFSRTETKLICDVAYASGMPLYPTQIGEYSVIFHEDGKADLVISGMDMPGYNWKEGTAQGGEPAFIVDYNTIMLEFIWLEDGCSMNLMNTMDIHYVPES